MRRAVERRPGAERIAAAFAKAGGAAAAADVLEELTLDGAQSRRQAVATTRAERPDTQVIAVAPTEVDRSDPEEGDPR